VSSASLGLCGTERSRPKQPRRRRPRVPRCRFSDHFLSQRAATCIACLHPVCTVCSLSVFSRGAPRLSSLVFSRSEVAVRELDSASLPRFSVCPNNSVFRFSSPSDISSPASTPSEPLSLSDCSPQLRQPLRRARICSAWRAAPSVLRFSHWFGSSTRSRTRRSACCLTPISAPGRVPSSGLVSVLALVFLAAAMFLSDGFCVH
jgi:hypothetical protein